ncbi:hypothetical protein D3C80_1066160 [compost metagenome]
MPRAKCRLSMRTVGRRTPSLRMIPISSASAAGRSPELPSALASDGTMCSKGKPRRAQRWCRSVKASTSIMVRMRLSRALR